MTKHILLGSGGDDGAQVAKTLSQFLDARAWIERCAVHVREEIKGADGLVAPATDGPNVAIELWTTAEPQNWEDEIMSLPLEGVMAFQVEESVEKGNGVYPVGPLSGVTQISFFWPAAGVSMADIRARWGLHPPLARRVHIGMDRYTRNWVVRYETAATNHWCGISVLHYPDDESFRERRYESPEGRAAVAYDAAGFSQPGKRHQFNSRTWVLR